MSTTNENKVELQPAYILHQRAYRETSAIVELLTRDFGRVSVIAKGVRNRKSPLRVVLQTFSPVIVSWQGRGELKNLVLAESPGQPLFLKDVALFSGLYVNELLMRLLPRFDACYELFADYQQCIVQLSLNSDIEPSLRIFEKRLLSSLGYELVLDVEAEKGLPIDAGKKYFYIAAKGPVESRMFDNMQGVISGSTLLALESEIFSEQQTLIESKKLLRQQLANLLGSKPLKTRELFRAFQKKVTEL